MLNMADTGGRRNEKPLTEEQFNQAKDYAVSLGMPSERIRSSDYSPTNYLGGVLDTLTIGTDVLPIGVRSKNPNDNISLKGGIAHEVVGHREADKKGRTISDSVPLNEAQASIRAARFASDLSDRERMDLIRDAITRLRKAGISVRSVKSQMFIDER